MISAMLNSADNLPAISDRSTPVAGIFDWIKIAAFCTAITVPGAMALSGAGREAVDGIERRKLANAPDWKSHRLTKMPAEIDAFFNDRIGFRRTFIALHNWYAWQSGVSPIPSIMIGRQNWLYFNGGWEMDDYVGMRPMPSVALERWKTSLEARQKWLSDRKIRYLFLVAPNKQTIHPEFLPIAYDQQHSSHTNFDVLAAAIRGNEKINFMDLRDPLRAEARQKFVYSPQDTHWNHFGQRVVYWEIMGRCRSWFSDEQLGPELRFTEQTVVGPMGGDLRSMLGLPGSEHKTSILVAEYPEKPRRIPDPSRKPWPPGYTENFENPRRQLRVLLFGDSFLAQDDFKIWIANHFQRTSVIYHATDFEQFKLIVEEHQPDLVIEECVERNIFHARSR